MDRRRGREEDSTTAAHYASYTNFDGSPEGFRHKSEVLAAHCKELNRDIDTIVRSTEYNVVIGSTEREVRDRLAWCRAHYEQLLHGDELERTWRALAEGAMVGTPEQIAERLARMQSLGLGYAILYFPEAAYDRTGVELFADQVAPALTPLQARSHGADQGIASR